MAHVPSTILPVVLAANDNGATLLSCFVCASAEGIVDVFEDELEIAGIFDLNGRTLIRQA